MRFAEKAHAIGVFPFKFISPLLGSFCLKTCSYWLELSLGAGPSSPIIMWESRHHAHPLLDGISQNSTNWTSCTFRGRVQKPLHLGKTFRLSVTHSLYDMDLKSVGEVWSVHFKLLTRIEAQDTEGQRLPCHPTWPQSWLWCFGGGLWPLLFELLRLRPKKNAKNFQKGSSFSSFWTHLFLTLVVWRGSSNLFCIPSGWRFKFREPPDCVVTMVHFSREANQLSAMTSMVLKVKTVEGGEIAVEVMPTNTIKELKAMLCEQKHCEDPIDRKILKVKVLADGLLVDDDQTLDSAGLLHAESEVTVIYSRNVVEDETEAIDPEGFLQVNIPSNLTEIPAGAFQDYHQVVKVVIPESVTAIGDFAFLGCSALESINIPESVTVIGNGAFENCKSLESITIPESVTAIGDGTFAMCYCLASITIPESVRSIGRSAFERCKSLESITLPESVAAIGDFAFQQCSSLKSITIPKSVTTIESGAFRECHCLESITIPANVWSIGNFAFLSCASLTSITIPQSVLSIGSFAFGNCSSLESITIPVSVLSIGNFAFQNCVSLTSITIPQSVTTIGRGAFEGCSSLESITIPESLRHTGGCAFDDKLQFIIQHVWLCLSVPIIGQDFHQLSWPVIISKNSAAQQKEPLKNRHDLRLWDRLSPGFFSGTGCTGIIKLRLWRGIKQCKSPSNLRKIPLILNSALFGLVI